MSFKDSRLGGFLEGVWHGFIIFGVIFLTLLLLTRWAAADERDYTMRTDRVHLDAHTTYGEPWIYLSVRGGPSYTTYIDRKDRDSYCARTNDFLTILQEMIDKEVARDPSVREVYKESEEGIRRAWCK